MNRQTLSTSLDDLAFMPKYLGELFYPGYFPLNPQNQSFSGMEQLREESMTLHDIIFDYYAWIASDFSTPEPPPLVFEILREYCIYYAHAPIWSMNPDGPMPGFIHWVAQSFEIKDWVSLSAWLIQAMDFGLNPF